MIRAVEHSVPFLPADKPRYAMGLGTPPQMLDMIARGIDMFDCVMPTRLARHGVAFTLDGPIHIKNKEFERDEGPLCECAHPHVARFSRAFIRHLFRAGEILALRLLSFHNLHFYVRLMRRAQQAVEAGAFPAFREDFLRRYPQDTSEMTALNTLTALLAQAIRRPGSRKPVRQSHRHDGPAGRDVLLPADPPATEAEEGTGRPDRLDGNRRQGRHRRRHPRAGPQHQGTHGRRQGRRRHHDGVRKDLDHHRPQEGQPAPATRTEPFPRIPSPPVMSLGFAILNDPLALFLSGLALLVLFFWYFATDVERRKRNVGSVLVLGVTALCALAVWPPRETIKGGIDIVGGSAFTLRVQPNIDEKGQPVPVTPDDANQAIKTIEKRLNTLGNKDLIIHRQGDDRIRVQMPGIEPEQAAGSPRHPRTRRQAGTQGGQPRGLHPRRRRPHARRARRQRRRDRPRLQGLPAQVRGRRRQRPQRDAAAQPPHRARRRRTSATPSRTRSIPPRSTSASTARARTR